MSYDKETTDSTNQKLIQFHNSYSKNSEPIRVNFRELCSQWKWAKRSDALSHLIHKYPAKILPYIPIFFLSSDNLANKNDLVLDPFAGTGTVLLESIAHPFLKRNCVGVDISPLARLIAKVKTTPLNLLQIEEGLARITSEAGKSSINYEIPQIPNIDYWFPKQTQIELAKLISAINCEEDFDLQDFFLVCFSSIIRDASLADPKIAPPVLLKSENFKENNMKNEIERLINIKKTAKSIDIFTKAVFKNQKRMESVSNIKEVSDRSIKASIIWDDAKNLRSGKLLGRGSIEKLNANPVKNNSVGLVITSPPYINAQKYVRTTKFELMWLGLINPKEIELFDRQFVGTERVFCEEYRELNLTGHKSADDIIKKIYQKDRRRAAIVYNYFNDMKKVIKEIGRVLKSDGRFILVVGNNTVCGIEVKNHEILRDLALNVCNFDVEMTLVDHIRSRGMITKRHETAGMLLDEWIIVLKKN